MSFQIAEVLSKTFRLRWLIIVSITLVVLTPQTSLAQQGTLTDDATVTIKKNDNHGTDATLRIEAGAGDASNVFVKFKLTSSLPAGTIAADISKATLKLFVGKLHTAGSFDVFRVLSPWSEQDKTVNPSINGSPDVIGIPVGSENSFVVIDITQLVKDWLNGVLPNNGIALVPSAGSSVDSEFDSKEDKDTSHEPRLEMVMTKGGSGTVTSITADSPLTVTNPTTTPNIALTGVVPLANGGTGLSTPGASANLLKSNGSVWTSAPLAASDIPPGSGNYIQNATSQQSSSNFNISGNGTANVFDAATQFNLGGFRVLAQGTFGSLFVGLNAGTHNTGAANSFFGLQAGFSNTTGDSNSFFGELAGSQNTTGIGNSFFGAVAGVQNTTGNANSFVGAGAGESNTTGSSNSFFGNSSGFLNTTGSRNSFFGNIAGASNTIGLNNSFFGVSSGARNTAGSSNSFFGVDAGEFNTTGQANSFFGGGAGFNNTTAASNSFFGFDTGRANTTGTSNSFFGVFAGLQNTTGSSNTFIGNEAGFGNFTGANNTFIGDAADFSGNNSNGANNTLLGSLSRVNSELNNATAIGAHAKVTQDNSLVLGSINGVNSATADTSVGIGTTAPKARLDVTGGNILVGSPGQGIILKSPNGGTCRLLAIDNAGNITLAAIACP